MEELPVDNVDNTVNNLGKLAFWYVEKFLARDSLVLVDIGNNDGKPLLFKDFSCG
ncbi:MAG: hypothetical protein ACOY9Y_11850 [Bacillota bacterium]